MREDYKIQGATAKIEVQVEAQVAEKLRAMESHAKLTQAELVNTALKRFIASHSDFLPKEFGKK